MDFLFGGKRDSRARDRGNYWQKSCRYGDSARGCTSPAVTGGSIRGSESPHLSTQHPIDPATEYKDRWRGTREKEMEVATSPGEDAPKRDRKRRGN